MLFRSDGAFLEKYRTLGGEIQKLKQKKISEANVRKLPVPSEIGEKIESMDRNEIAFDPVLVGQLIEKIVVRNARRIEVVFKSGLVENGFLETED